MIASLALALLVTFSGTIVTYLYDENASLATRLCTGVCLGLAVFSLVAFLVASLVGLTMPAILISAAICCSPLALIVDPATKTLLKQDLQTISNSTRRLFLRPDLESIGYFLFYAVTTVILWKVFDRAVMEDATGISTGLLNNFGDLPFHLSVITSFAYGNNYPPEDPTYAGVSFTYPFLSDFASAIFVRCGASLRDATFIVSYMLAMAFVGLVHRWALVLLRDRLAAILTPLIVLFNGGMGWVLLLEKANTDAQGLWGVLVNLPPSFTVIPDSVWRWGNAISALLVPQRGFLMGLPLAVIAFTQWWLALEKESDAAKRETTNKAKTKQRRTTTQPATPEPVGRFPIRTRRMMAAGVAAGLLPLVHAHSFVVVMGMAACLALIYIRWREWFAFFAVASAIAIPQLLWSTLNSAVDASTFFAWQLGWDRGQENPIVFWFKNTGLFIPLIFAAVLLRFNGYLVGKRLLMFYLPFTLCFIIPNFVKMAPWIWDNIKVLYYWWLASAPLVALLLAKLWQQGRIRRVIAGLLFVCVTLAGALDVFGIAFRSVKYDVFDAAGVQFAEKVKERTAPRSLIIHAPVHNTPVFLTGRRSLMGYPGHIWTHGLEFMQREGEIKRIYLGAPDAMQLLKNYEVDYAVIGPLERIVTPPNEQFFSQFEKVEQVGEYSLYKIR
ncbi:MAG TPA: hypothetical protein VHH35_02855 [Pyrinomonadaceae bacterium]|nr:hypothetical protein [Pyrinomonadaceae bacterium]